jgi:AbrB family looped-hinge helix DNA binding protein
MTSKGQITVPDGVRATFDLRAGAKVDFIVNAAGELVLRPRSGDIRAFRGLIAHSGPPVSLEEMAVAEGAAEAFARSVT